jgi:parvulin-like peptidyl-prolyl isomerase
VEVLDQALAAEFQVEVQPAQVEEKLAGLEAMLAESGMTAAQYLGVEEASDEMLWFNAEVLALQELALDQLVVDPEVVVGLFADPATLTTVCSRHILVGTEEEAEEVEARLAAGEDFAAVADEVSLDTRSEGGDLGCVLAGSFAPEYRAAAMEAAIGEVTGPVAVESGFHLLVVYERTAHTREEYLSAPRSLLSEDLLSGIWSDWYLARLQAADVWVNERYGTWSTGGILAPSAGE